MRLRIGITLGAVFAVFLSPINPSARAFSGFASAPQSITVSALVLGLRVGWSAPADTDSGVTGYKVEYSTSGTSGSWTLATTTNSSTFSYDITGLSASATYVRVAATTAGGTGLYGYPWMKLYGTTSMNRNGSNAIDYESGFGSQSGDPYQTLNAASFTRVRMRMDATINSTAYFAETDFYNWNSSGDTTKTTSQSATPSVQNLIIPSKGGSYNQTIHGNVTDLNVFSNSTNVVKGNLTLGRLEIWPWDYGTGTSGLNPSNANNNYDWDDLPSAPTGGSYGSFQVHDLVNNRPVFVWNHHDNGVHPEIAFGPAPSGNPDWTFCSTVICPKPTAFLLQIFVNIPTTPTPDSTAPTVSRIDAKTYMKNGDTMTVRSTEAGTVYLVRNSVTVTNLSSITNAASNLRNSVSISAANTSTTLNTSGLLDGTFNLYAVDGSGNVSNAVANTVTMDSTPPTVTSKYLASNGVTVFLNMSETVTHTSMGDTLYTISDGGPINNVGSVGGTSTQLQISVYRAIPAGATVNFAYTPSAGAASGRWVDQAGNELAAIALGPITNNSTAGVSVALSVPTTIYKGLAQDISTVVNYPGKVTFFDKGKRIAGCIGKNASGTPPITVTCSYKAPTRGNTSLTAIYTPTNNSIAGGVTPVVSRYILNRTGLR